MKNSTLVECAEACKKGFKPPYNGCFERILEKQRRNPEEHFRENFANCIREGLSKTALKGEDLGVFLQFLPQNRLFTKETLLLNMDRVLEKLKQREEELRDKQKQQSKLALCLGAFGGLFLIIILL